MKILIASDIHGSLSAAKKVMDAFFNEKADYLIFLGDALYHGPRNPLPCEYDPAGVANLLNTIKDKVIAIRGNCDSEVDGMLLHFPITAEYQNIILHNGKLFATHGHIFDQGSIPVNVVSGDIFAFGHIHIPIAEYNESGIMIFNPGSASLPKENHPPTYGVLTNEKVEIKEFNGEIYKKLMR